MVVSGRYKGKFPDSVKARGTLADSSNFVVDIKAQKAKNMPIDKVMFQVVKLVLLELRMKLINDLARTRIYIIS